MKNLCTRAKELKVKWCRLKSRIHLLHYGTISTAAAVHVIFVMWRQYVAVQLLLAYLNSLSSDLFHVLLISSSTIGTLRINSRTYISMHVYLQTMQQVHLTLV